MSDLCTGSGYSYAGIIDSDISYDEFGLPYIPARRLKGCMKEAAELVCPEIAETLFGKSGDNKTKGAILGNAYLEDYDKIAKELENLQNGKKKEAAWLSPQNILNMYTAIRAQTRICQDTGIAEENSLRYTRVVGQYDPQKERTPLCFYAEVEFDKNCQEQMRRIMKAVRNIGMNRNRGLGSVRCTLIDEHEVELKEDILAGPKNEEQVCLTYILCNREPLLMSSDNVEVSDSCISGKSILGTLAGAYLHRESARGDSEEFRNLFLDGSTIFTDANITFPPKEKREDAVQWPDYYPAPLYLNRLKKTKVLVNLLAEDKNVSKEREKDYNTAEGNLPKKLKTHYIHKADSNTYCITEPKREIYYHNSHRKLLYSQEAMQEGQYFQGKIYVSKKYAYLLKELLEESRLSFGKSKTAQYGACGLAAEITVNNVREEMIGAKEGERLAVIFCSDAVFLDGASGYTIRFEEVKELTASRLGIPYDRTRDEGSMLQTKEITGYNTTWNLRRPGIPAVKAGGVLIYTIPKGKSWQKTISADQFFVGERNQEGYGQIQIIRCSDMVYAPSKIENVQDREIDDIIVDNCRPFLINILKTQLLERLIFLYTRQRPELGLTAATIGRLNLMLLESLDTYRTNHQQAFKDFCTRISSIKRKREREKAFDLLYKILLKDGYKEDIYELDFEKMAGPRGDSYIKDIEGLLKKYTTQPEYQSILTGIWGEYIENILTYHKYLKKHEGGKEHHE